MKPCINCNSEQSQFLVSQDLNRKVSDHDFTYLRCNSCHYISLDTVPSNLGSYYADGYYGPPPKSAEDLLAAAKIYEKYKIDLVQQYCGGIQSVLEIGPSMGGFALLCKDQGYSVRTIEMSEECSRFLNDVAHIPTQHTDNEIQSLQSEPGADLVAMWHVIEHVKNPFLLLQAALKKVNPGGYILIAAPNPEALQFRLLKDRWAHLDAPRHTCLLPLSLLKSKLKNDNFSVVAATTRDPGGIQWNQFGWEHSHSKTFNPKNLFKKNMIRALGFIEKSFDVGACYTLIARRDA